MLEAAPEPTLPPQGSLDYIEYQKRSGGRVSGRCYYYYCYYCC